MTKREAVIWLINLTADIGKAEHIDLWHYEKALSEIKEMLESEPEQKKGKWIFDGRKSQNHVEKIYICSACENFEAWGKMELYNFCPNCGAYMKGEQDE